MNFSDWTVLNPAALAALLALGLPALIHLISRGRGRKVLVGRLDWFQSARPRPTWALRLTRWLLLAVRTLLMVIAALWLAGVARIDIKTLEGEASYLTTSWVAQATDAERDALSGRSNVHVLVDGYPAWQGQVMPPGISAQAWLPLLAERLSAVRHRGEVHVYIGGTADEWISGAAELTAVSRWHVPERTSSPAEISLQVSVVHSGDRAEDAAAFESAFESLRIQRLPGLSWRTQTLPRPDGDEATRANVVIWLADEPPEVKAGQLVVTDLGANSNSKRTALRTPDFPSRHILADRAPSRAVRPGDEYSLPVWRDENGVALWLDQQINGGLLRSYQGSLSAATNTWLGRPEFPGLLLSVMLSNSAWQNSFAHAIAAPGARAQAEPSALSAPRQSLGPQLGALLLLLFLIERVLSEWPTRHRRAS